MLEKKIAKIMKEAINEERTNMGIFLEKQDHSMKVPIEHEFEFVGQTFVVGGIRMPSTLTS